MTVTLTGEIEELVNERVKSGVYRSAEEVILLGLRLLKAQEEALAELRREIQAGMDDIQQGRFKTYTTDAELADLVAAVVKGGQERKDRASQ